VITFLKPGELVEQIKANPYLKFFIGLEAFQYSAPFDLSMMVYFRKRLLEAVVNDCNERIVRHGLKVIRSSDPNGPGDDEDSGGSTSSTHQPQSSPKKQTNQGLLLIDAACAPVDICYPTDLSLLIEAREVTEMLIEAMHPHVRESFWCKPVRTAKGRGSSFLQWPKRKGPVSARSARRSNSSLATSIVICRALMP
jgi:IS5 family transposase